MVFHSHSLMLFLSHSFFPYKFSLLLLCLISSSPFVLFFLIPLKSFFSSNPLCPASSSCPRFSPSLRSPIIFFQPFSFLQSLYALPLSSPVSPVLHSSSSDSHFTLIYGNPSLLKSVSLPPAPVLAPRLISLPLD